MTWKWSTACREVSESLLLFMRLQNEHKSKSTLKQLNSALQITLSQQPEEEGSPDSIAYSLNILSNGLGAYFIDGRLFLTKLCEHCDGLGSLLTPDNHRTDREETLLELKSRRIGDCLNVSCFQMKGFSSSNERQPIIVESVQPRPEHLQPTSLLMIAYKIIFSNLEELKREALILSTHLHLMHLINPDVSMKFVVKDVSKVKMFCVELEAEPFKVLARKAPFKLATSLRHFIQHSSVQQQSKLHMIKGDTYIIPGSVGTPTTSPSFKIYSAAAILPQLQLRNKKKIPANKLCKQLHIFVFGPFNTPLVVAGSRVNFPLSCLAEWENYGLSLRETSHRMEEETTHNSSVSPSFLCELSNTRRPSFSVAATHHLVLFLFLEDSSQRHGSLTGDSSQWRQDVELLHRLREQFQNLVVSHSKKFQSSTHSVLNKLICNYGSHAKTSTTMSAAIPLISDSVTSIVENSSSEEFKRTCRELTGADCEEELKKYVEQKLWKIAKDRLQVTEHPGPSALNPDEPTSPEINQAVTSTSSDGCQSKRDPSSTNDHQQTNSPLLEASSPLQPGTLTHSDHPTDREEVGHFTRHTLPTTNVLKTRLLSVASKQETVNNERNGDDCFNALEVADDETIAVKSVQQVREGSSDMEQVSSSMDLSAVQIVDHLGNIGEAQHEEPSSNHDSHVDWREWLESENESEIDDKDCLDDGNTQAVSSPSLLGLHQPVDTTASSPDRTDCSNFDDLEYVFDEDTLTTADNDCTEIKNDYNITASNLSMGENYCTNEYWRDSDSTMDRPSGTNDTSFTELEHFEEDNESSLCAGIIEDHITTAQPSPAPQEGPVGSSLPPATVDSDFDELEYFSDGGNSTGSTCMASIEDHSTQDTTQCPTDGMEVDGPQEATQEKPITWHIDLRCSDEGTLAAWLEGVSDYDQPTLPDAGGEQYLPQEEGGAAYSSDEEWNQLAHYSSSPHCMPTNPGSTQAHLSVNPSPPTASEPLKECPPVPSVCNQCGSEGDSFDQLELYEDEVTLSPRATNVANGGGEYSVTVQDFDWD